MAVVVVLEGVRHVICRPTEIAFRLLLHLPPWHGGAWWGWSWLAVSSGTRTRYGTQVGETVIKVRAAKRCGWVGSGSGEWG